MSGACGSLQRHPADGRTADSGDASYQPALFHVTPPRGYAGSAWILGAVHAGRNDFYPLPSSVVARWQQADLLAVELDVRQRRAQLRGLFAQAALLPDSERIDRYLDKQTIVRLRNRFDISNDSWAGLSRLRPWALTRALYTTQRETRRTSEHLGVEQLFLQQAKKRGISVVELEEPGEQVVALTGGTLAEQIALLRFRASSAQFWDNKLDELIGRWRRGDQAGLLRLKTDAFGTDAVRAGLRQRLFTDRDQRMARRLLNMLREQQTIFVVVGTYHLVGQANLLTELSGLGATVSRHRYSIEH